MNGLVVLAPLTGLVRPLADVPDQVFASGMMGPGLAIDPIGDTLHAPCDGVVTALHQARHALTITAADGATLLIHLGIDTVALGGAGIEALVAVGETVTAGMPLLRFDLDHLVCAATAVVTPVIATDDGARIELLAEGLVTAGTPLFRLMRGTNDVEAPRSDAAITRSITVRLPHGIHARPAAAIVAAMRAHDAAVTMTHGVREASATSVTALLGLGAGAGTTLHVAATGPAAHAALDAVEAMLGDTTAEAQHQPPAAAKDGPGVPAAPGLAIGPAFRWRRAAPEVATESRGATAETDRLADAIARVRTRLTAVSGATGPRGAVIAAHAEMLDDPALLADVHARIATGSSAAIAYRAAIAAQSALLTSSGDPRIAARVDDLRDLEARVLGALSGHIADGPAVPPGSIVIADELLPSEVVALADGGAAGFALAGGGPTSHAAILAAGAGVPMIVALGTALDAIGDGTLLILDADHGGFKVDPSLEDLTAARTRIDHARALAAHDGAPTTTADGVRIELFANIGSPADARAAVAAGAEGCGLLRTEFLFLDRDTPPDQAEQRAAYRAIADILGDRPMILRLLDIGGDKPAPYLALPREENPALGVRGVRVSLAHPNLLDAQLAAAIATGCRIMIPMIASLAELDAVIDRAIALGGSAGSIGVMVETPAAAITADLLAARAAFLSIGTNDLTQYALAMDRGNPGVAAGIDGLHPAVLRLVAEACAGAAIHAKPVGVCGGLAADPLAVPILLGLGVTELSMPPACIGAVRAVVRRLDLAAARRHARSVLDLPSAAAVRAAAQRFAGDRG